MAMVKINGKCLCEYCFAEIGKKQVVHDCAGDDRKIYPNALTVGAVLAGRYVVGKVLGQGGFGITYLCYDTKEDKRVAVKEFFPRSMVDRKMHDSTVMVSSVGQQDSFDRFKKQFYNEAKTISQFSGHPNIVRVFLFFEENNTAYFSMEYLDGMDLKDYLIASRTTKKTISESNALYVLQTVANALLILHSVGVIHRDIAPDNIRICKDGTLKLFDFGASRFVVGGATHTLDTVLKNGYAPVEQYAPKGNQGPWTDIYALGVTIYVMLTDTLIPDAPTRVAVKPPLSVDQNGISKVLFRVLEKMMEVYPEDRIKSIVELNRELAILSIKPEPLKINETAKTPDEYLKDAFRLLKIQNWTGAEANCNNALQIDQNCVEAYRGKLLAELHVTEEEQLRDCRRSFEKSNNYRKIIQLGEQSLIDQLNGYLVAIKRRKKMMMGGIVAATTVCLAVVLAIVFNNLQPPEPSTTTAPTEPVDKIITDDKQTTTELTTSIIDTDSSGDDWKDAASNHLYRPSDVFFVDSYKAIVFCIDKEIQDFAKMRFGPSKTQFDVTGNMIQNYESVTVKTISVNGWCLCEDQNVLGWIRSDFLFRNMNEILSLLENGDIMPSGFYQVDITDPKAGEQINMRDAPQQEAALISTIPNGAHLKISDATVIQNGRVYVTCLEQSFRYSGYVLTKYLTYLKSETGDESVSDWATEESADSMKKIYIVSAKTVFGTELEQSNVSSDRSFGAEKVIDGDGKTCWCVNTEEKGGVGAVLKLTLNNTGLVSGIRLVNGNMFQMEDSVYLSNGQVKDFKVSFSDGSSQYFSAQRNEESETNYQSFEFDHPITTSEITLSVLSGYEGVKFNTNVCIGEIEIF